MIHKDAAKKQQPAQHPRWEGHHEMHARPAAWEGHHEMHARPAAWEGHHEMHARPAVWEWHDDLHARPAVWEWHDDLHARPPAPQALLVNAQQTSAAFSPVIVHTAAANPAKQTLTSLLETEKQSLAPDMRQDRHAQQQQAVRSDMAQSGISFHQQL